MASLEVGGYYGSVLLRPRGVPQVQLHILVVDADGLHLEVHSGDQCALVGQELPLDVPPEQRSLAHVDVPHDYYFVPRPLLILALLITHQSSFTLTKQYNARL